MRGGGREDGTMWYQMVTQNMCARMKENISFLREKYPTVTALDLVKCLKQNKKQRLISNDWLRFWFS